MRALLLVLLLVAPGCALDARMRLEMIELGDDLRTIRKYSQPKADLSPEAKAAYWNAWDETLESVDQWKRARQMP